MQCRVSKSLDKQGCKYGARCNTGERLKCPTHAASLRLTAAGLSLRHRSAQTLDAKSAGLPSKDYMDIAARPSPFIGHRTRPDRSRKVSDNCFDAQTTSEM